MPRLIGRDLHRAVDVAPLLSAIRGHQMAKAGVENAIWHAEAEVKAVPLAKLLGGTLDEIACGVSLGIREDSQALVRKVEEELRCGYQRIKLKIKPGKVSLSMLALASFVWKAYLISYAKTKSPLGLVAGRARGNSDRHLRGFDPADFASAHAQRRFETENDNLGARQPVAHLPRFLVAANRVPMLRNKPSGETSRERLGVPVALHERISGVGLHAFRGRRAFARCLEWIGAVDRDWSRWKNFAE